LPLTPHQRALRARLAAHAIHKAGHGQIDPNGVLPKDERLKRAEHARHEHMVRMAFESSKARQRKRGAA
jgi:hypothetical protein